MAHRTGIDLGTTNSAIAFTELGRQRCVKVEKNEYTSAVFPSCVGLGRDGQPVYGARARRTYPSVREFKRWMGTDEDFELGPHRFTPIQLSSLLLAEMKAAFEREYGEVEGAVITVPANFGDKKRAATREAGELAGLEVLRIINEPSAAAIAYARSGKPPGENALVIDWGGGTLDVSLIDCVQGESILDIKANDGEEWCGGANVDEKILEILQERHERELGAAMRGPLAKALRNELLLKCEEVKIHLSREEEWDEPIDVRSLKLFLDFQLTRRELEGAVTPLVHSVMAAVHRCLDKAPEGRLSPRDVTEVILVGGSCRLPLLRRRVRETVEGLEPWDEKEIQGLPLLTAGSFPIHITFDYSVEQVLTVRVDIPGHKVSETWKAVHVQRLEGQRKEASEGIEAFRSSSLEALADYLERVRARLDGNATDEIRGLLARLGKAVDAGDIAGAREAKQALGVALFDAGIRL